MNEQQIEQDLINKLESVKYVYHPKIHDRETLEQNFRAKFEQLNYVKLTDSEFERLLEQIISPDVFQAAKTLRQQNHFVREDGTPLYFTLVNLKDWCKNDFEVINQLRINTKNSHHRYDVMLLINGVPMVQFELKTLTLSPRRAMQQIVQYKNDPGNGYANSLLCFMQLFVISNQSDTWYFANNSAQHFSFNADERFLPLYQFAGEDNRKITHLDLFVEKFLTKCALSEMISRYMVLVESEKKLMVMRPYQIYAVKAIVDCIHQSCGNGYIWHTTGSGKTLTSFKASTLLKDNPEIEKCLFVVDRKDLDRQTREEFNRFQPNSVEENTNTAKLVERLLSNDYADKVIVTTIQKLGLALDETNRRNFKQQLEPLRHKRIVFIFDECHRSQFGANHQAIKDFFPNAQLFGFTGTPIFSKNATYKQITGDEATLKTTQDIFQQRLHAYTITDAIEDRNVLRFRVDYYKPEGAVPLQAGQSLTKQAIVAAILKEHDKVTAGRKFNAILATASINDAIEFYSLFKQAQTAKLAETDDFVPLNVACVFSPPADGNPDVRQIQEDLPQEYEDNQVEPDLKKAALKAIIADYNAQYATNFNINEFDAYYQDVQKRIKDQQYPNSDVPHAQKIDLVIVVDMLLTGFDSKYLNTLYVDKNLRYHGLIQAFSRTNRILNDTKPYGNIINFRVTEKDVDEAISLFSGIGDEAQARKIWLVDPAPEVIEKLATAVEKLEQFMHAQGLDYAPAEVPNIKGDAARAEFINVFKDVQRIKTQLDQYTDLDAEDAARIEQLMPDDDLQAFRGVYLDIAQRLKEQQDKADALPEVQQLDFEFVLFASAIIDYDYIMNLIAKYTQAPAENRAMNRDQLVSLIESDAKFVGERAEITAYINTLQVGEPLTEAEIRAGYEAFKAEEHTRQMAEIATKYGLELNSLQQFVDLIVQRLIFDAEQLNDLLAPLNLGWKARTKQELALMDDLIPLLRKLVQGREISGLGAYEE